MILRKLEGRADNITLYFNSRQLIFEDKSISNYGLENHSKILVHIDKNSCLEPMNPFNFQSTNDTIVSVYSH